MPSHVTSRVPASLEAVAQLQNSLAAPLIHEAAIPPLIVGGNGGSTPEATSPDDALMLQKFREYERCKRRREFLVLRECGLKAVLLTSTLVFTLGLYLAVSATWGSGGAVGVSKEELFKIQSGKDDWASDNGSSHVDHDFIHTIAEKLYPHQKRNPERDSFPMDSYQTWPFRHFSMDLGLFESYTDLSCEKDVKLPKPQYYHVLCLWLGNVKGRIKLSDFMNWMCGETGGQETMVRNSL